MFGRVKVVGILVIVALFAVILGSLGGVNLASAAGGDLQLNLSHIECVDGQVEIHFVLLNVPDGITPGTLTYTYGIIEPGAHTGNVWHYTDTKADGFYDVASASVDVDGTLVTLHNPHDYADDYDCAPPQNEANLIPQEDCEGWAVVPNGPITPGATVTGAVTGGWDVNGSATYSFTVSWTSGTPDHIDFSGTLYQPEGCEPHVNTASIELWADCENYAALVFANGPFHIVGQNFFTWAENPAGSYDFTVVFDTLGVPTQIQFTAGGGDNPFAQLPEECTPPVDVCPNLEGDQATIPDGMVIDDAGNCVPPPPPPPPDDYCPNLDGIQDSVPEGMIVDANGNCIVPPPPPPQDFCPNIDGVQDIVPEGMVIDDAGNCVVPPPPPPVELALCAWVGYDSLVGHTYNLVDANTPQVYVNYPAIESKGELWVLLDASIYAGNRYRLILDDGTLLLSFQLVGNGEGNDLHLNCLTDVTQPPQEQQAPATPVTTCANCGPAVRETIPDNGVAIVYHAETIGCTVDLCNPDNLIFYVDYEGLVPFSVDGVEAEMVTNAFGTFYRLFNVSADAELVLLDENGQPYSGPLATYTACSIWPTGARVNADNTIEYYPGATEYDVALWLTELGVDPAQAQIWAHDLAMQAGGSLPLPADALP